MKYIRKMGKAPWREQLGITGLETAIVLIAFVVVSSVFAFASLSTGLFSADKSKETIQAGLSEARGTIEVRAGMELKAVLSTGETAVAGEGAATGDTSYKLTKIPVLPGSEVIQSGSTVLTLGKDYTINYDTGRVTLTKEANVITATYSNYEISTADINVANSAGARPST